MVPILEIRDLVIEFSSGGKRLPAVDGVDLTVNQAETLAVVGESGCGKSVTCLAAMRLLPSPPARLARGEIVLDGRVLTTLPEWEMRRIRGKEMAMVFQEPMTSFDPVFTIGDQLMEAVLAHEDVSPDQARVRTAETLAEVGMPDPELIMARYPHELSGGMKQRAMIAMALSCHPRILLCDEPTTALDVTIQAQILDLLARLREERRMSMLFITHNLGIVAELAQRVSVMYAGKVVESATTADLYAGPLHPYSIGLFDSLPRLASVRGKLNAIPGIVPGLADRPPGCAFWPRCARAREICRKQVPPLEEKKKGRFCACHRVDKHG